MSSLAALRKRAWQVLRDKIDEQTADPVILSKLRGHFEEKFRYDEHNVPRVWKPDDDIDGAFKKAKDQVCFLIKCNGGAVIDPPHCRLLNLFLSMQRLPLLILRWNIPSPPTLLTRYQTMTSTSLQPSSYSQRLRPWTCQQSSAVMLTRTTWRQSGALLPAWHKSRTGCMVSWSSLVGTRLWLSCLTHCTSHSCLFLWPPREFDVSFILSLIVEQLMACRYAIIQLGLAGPLFQVLRTVGGEVSFLNFSYWLPPPHHINLGPTPRECTSTGTLLPTSPCRACACTYN